MPCVWRLQRSLPRQLRVLDIRSDAPAPNALFGSSGPHWDGENGTGRFAGFDYERAVARFLLLRLTFGQAYNGGDEDVVREFSSAGVPLRESTVTDFSRLVLGGQIGALVPLSPTVRAVAFGGPTWTRVSRNEHRFVTDLRFGGLVQAQRESTSEGLSGLLFGAGLEFDIADTYAWRVMALHNRAEEDRTTTLAFGGVLRF